MAYAQGMEPQLARMFSGAAGLDTVSRLICIARAGELARDLLDMGVRG